MSLTSPPGLHAAQTRATLRAIYIAPPSAVTPPPPSRRVERRERRYVLCRHDHHLPNGEGEFPVYQRAPKPGAS